jgi:hypothetical protein
VCGFNLGFEAWNGDSPSDEICPCCGIQFGYTDCADGGVFGRKRIYREWRAAWVAEGMPWRGANPTPANYNPKLQLEIIGVA